MTPGIPRHRAYSDCQTPGPGLLIFWLSQLFCSPDSRGDSGTDSARDSGGASDGDSGGDSGCVSD